MHFSPRGLQQVPMDAQWMLKGCSMDAQTLLLPLSPLQKAYICLRKFVTDLSLRNLLQRYNFFFIFPNFLPQNDHFSSFSCICHFFVVLLHRKSLNNRIMAQETLDSLIQVMFTLSLPEQEKVIECMQANVRRLNKESVAP